MRKQCTAWLWRAGVVLCLAVCLASGYAAGKGIWEQRKAASLYRSLANTVMEAAGSSSGTQQDAKPFQGKKESGATNKKELEEDTKKQKERAYQLLYEQNPDFAAWLQIESTKINYPVMAAAEKDYYLYRDFEKQYSRYGTPYMDLGYSPEHLGTVIIYGHHMKDGSMFAGLSDYKDSQFCKEHSQIRADYFTGGKLKEAVYTVFAVILIPDAGNMEYPFYEAAKVLEKGGPEVYSEYICQVKKYALYETGITPQYEDRLLLLSTCDYAGTDGRLLVLAAADSP